MHPEQIKRAEFILGEILTELQAIRMELEWARLERAERLKNRLFLKCRNAEKRPNGLCSGFQVSHFDDEPIEQCKRCEEFESYDPEPES